MGVKGWGEGRHSGRRGSGVWLWQVEVSEKSRQGKGPGLKEGAHVCTGGECRTIAATEGALRVMTLPGAKGKWGEVLGPGMESLASEAWVALGHDGNLT